MNALLQTWQFWALLSALFAALTAIFAKIGVDDIHPDIATLIRTLVVVVALVIMLFVTQNGATQLTLSTKAVVFLILSGLATAGSWICYFRAMKIGEAARVAPVDKLSVVLVALIGVLFLGEKLSTLNWVGIVLITMGIMLTVID